MAASKDELFGILGVPDHVKELDIANGKLKIVVRGLSFAEQLEINKLAMIGGTDDEGNIIPGEDLLVRTFEYGIHEPSLDRDEARTMFRSLGEEDVFRDLRRGRRMHNRQKRSGNRRKKRLRAFPDVAMVLIFAERFGLDPLATATKYTPRVVSTWMGMLDALPEYSEWTRLARLQNEAKSMTQEDFHAIAEMKEDEYDLFLGIRQDLMPEEDET